MSNTTSFTVFVLHIFSSSSHCAMWGSDENFNAFGRLEEGNFFGYLQVQCFHSNLNTVGPYLNVLNCA